MMCMNWDLPIREVSSFQRVLCTGFNGVETQIPRMIYKTSPHSADVTADKEQS